VQINLRFSTSASRWSRESGGSKGAAGEEEQEEVFGVPQTQELADAEESVRCMHVLLAVIVHSFSVCPPGFVAAS
jgi:hypothetical protein